MTLLDPSDHSSSQPLFVSAVDFPQVLALPRRERLPEGDVLVFHFPNGYGAAVTHLNGLPDERAFEFGVLDCTDPDPRLTDRTPVCAGVLHGLAYRDVAGLLPQVERLPLHPAVQAADVKLTAEEF